MADPVALVQGVLGPLRRGLNALKGIEELKTTLRRRYGDYSSVIETLGKHPEIVTSKEIERELERLTELFTTVADLIGEYTAAPGDGILKKFNIKAKRAAWQDNVNDELDIIDVEVMRQLSIISLKEAISVQEIELLRSLGASVDHVASLVQQLIPPSLPVLARVPDGAVTLPKPYVKRASMAGEVISYLTSTERNISPYKLIGMGGGGKTFLASSVVEDEVVRQYFQQGMFWVRVGREGKGQLKALLEGLARDISRAPTDTPHGVPHEFDSSDEVIRHLTMVVAGSRLPRLVVLDDVWDGEVVDALIQTGLVLLVTTRNRSVVPQGGCTEVGDMTEGEALELLKYASGASQDLPQPESSLVADDCGFLPLALVIIGAMDDVKKAPDSSDTWRKIHTGLAENLRTFHDTPDHDSNNVLDFRFRFLSSGAKDRFRRLGVLAQGTLATDEMLSSLWGQGDTKLVLKDLVAKSLLQVVGERYRLHDLVLFSAKAQLRSIDRSEVRSVTLRQAQYLGRLDIVRLYYHAEGSQQGLYALSALWRSILQLSDDKQLQVDTYNQSLGELGDATAGVAGTYRIVASLFSVQGVYQEGLEKRKEALARTEHLSGEDHREEVAKDLRRIAQLMIQMSQFDEAEAVYLRLIEMEERTTDKQCNSAAGEPYLSLAELLQKKGDRRRLEFYKKALITMNANPDEDPVGRAFGMVRVSRFFANQGRFKDSEDILLECLDTVRKQPGSALHEARILANLAHQFRDEERYEEAEVNIRDAIVISEIILGPENRDLVEFLSLQSKIWKSMGKGREALEALNRALDIQKRIYGKSHPLVAGLIFEMARLLKSMAEISKDEQGVTVLSEDSRNKRNEAMALYQQVLDIHEEASGPEDVDVALALYQMGCMRLELDENAEAKTLFLKALSIYEKRLTPTHKSIKKCQQQLLLVTLKQDGPLEGFHPGGRYSPADRRDSGGRGGGERGDL